MSIKKSNLPGLNLLKPGVFSILLNADLDLVIARSGGKGTNAIPTASSESIAAAKKNLADQFTDDIQPSPEAITRSRSPPL